MRTDDFDPDLFDAVEFGDFEWLQRSIGNGSINKHQFNINAQDINGVTILMLAAYYGHAEIVGFLLNQSADPNLKDTQGRTALMRAKDGGHIEVVQLLLELGVEL